MDASGKEEISVKFIMEADGTISDVIQGKDKGDPAAEEAPTEATWASAVVASKNSPGKIYVWTGTKWKCIKA